MGTECLPLKPTIFLVVSYAIMVLLINDSLYFQEPLVILRLLTTFQNILRPRSSVPLVKKLLSVSDFQLLVSSVTRASIYNTQL